MRRGKIGAAYPRFTGQGNIRRRPSYDRSPVLAIATRAMRSMMSSKERLCGYSSSQARVEVIRGTSSCRFCNTRKKEYALARRQAVRALKRVLT